MTIEDAWLVPELGPVPLQGLPEVVTAVPTDMGGTVEGSGSWRTS